MFRKSLFSLLATALLASLALTGSARAAANDGAGLNLVPWPASVKTRSGAMALTGGSRIVAEDAALLGLAQVLAQEIETTTGLALKAVQGRAGDGDIALALDSKLKGEAYRVTVNDKAVAQGKDYKAVGMATATLLQALASADGKVSLPKLTIEDAPEANYRGLMVDVARKFHSIESLEQMINLCRLYKINFLQLHLTDDPLWMFPSKAYPKLGTKNHPPSVKPYTIQELKDLVAYADERGVTIIPEFDMPGHCASLVRTMPELFAIEGTKPYIHHASINFNKPEVMEAVETIVAEMCEVFESTPYFHIGGDEADLALANQNAEFKAMMQKKGHSVYDLYCGFLTHMNEVVKSHGKKTIVWEGFHRGGKVKVPKDVTVMAYEIRFYQPGALVADGYKVINASWTPLYVVNKLKRPASEIYAWDKHVFKPYGAKAEDKGKVIEPSDLVIGAQMCSWEQPEAIELSSLRGRVPAMAERLWNPNAGRGYADYEARFTATDKVLDKLVE